MHIPHFAHLFTTQFLHLSPHVKLRRLHTKSRGLASPESRSPDDKPQVTGAVAEAHVPLTLVSSHLALDALGWVSPHVE